MEWGRTMGGGLRPTHLQQRKEVLVFILELVPLLDKRRHQLLDVFLEGEQEVGDLWTEVALWESSSEIISSLLTHPKPRPFGSLGQPPGTCRPLSSPSTALTTLSHNCLSPPLDWERARQGQICLSTCQGHGHIPGMQHGVATRSLDARGKQGMGKREVLWGLTGWLRW